MIQKINSNSDRLESGISNLENLKLSSSPQNAYGNKEWFLYPCKNSQG